MRVVSVVRRCLQVAGGSFSEIDSTAICYYQSRGMNLGCLDDDDDVDDAVVAMEGNGPAAARQRLMTMLCYYDRNDASRATCRTD